MKTIFMICLTMAASLLISCDPDDDGADGPNVNGIELVKNLAGTYTVTGTVSGSHTRNTIVISSDGNIDFDQSISFTAGDIKVIYDRISCCNRIQVSHGADDDGEVINLFITNTQQLERVQFRHRNNNIDNEVNVVKQ